MGKGGSNTGLILGLVAVVAGIAAWRTGMLCSPMNVGCEFQSGGTTEDDGSLANRCWAVGNGKLACSCAGEQYHIMGANRTCSDCEAQCRGSPRAPAKGGSVKGASDRCFTQSTGSAGKRVMCQCQGSAKAFAMGPRYNQMSTKNACSACKVECNKRRVNLAEEFEPNFGEGLAFAGYTAMGSAELNRLTIA